MRVLAAVAVLTLGSVAANLSAPLQVRACTGPSIEFADALRASRGSIYAGRITRVTGSRLGSSKVTIDVDIVVRGPANQTLAEVIAPFVCDPIVEGQWGYMVRDVRDPQYATGSADVFFAIGTSVARPALRAAGLPQTATAIERRPPSGPNDAFMPWLVVALTAYLTIYGLLSGRPNRVRPAADTGRSRGPRPPSRS